MKIFTTIILSLATLALITASVFLTIDGNLAKLTGWYRVTPGMPLFTKEHANQLDKVCWFRLTDLHDTLECEKDAQGQWWIKTPYKDKLDPRVAEVILAFAKTTTIIDTLTVDESAQGNMRDFGLTSDFCSVVLKIPSGKSLTTAARFKLGKAAPWLASAGDGKTILPTTYLQSDFYGDDERVHVVSGNITPLFKSGLTHMRDPQPLRYDPNELVYVGIESAGADKLELSRKDEKNPWILQSKNNKTQADQENTVKLIGMLCSLKAVRVLPTEDVPQLPTSPLHSITVRDTKGKQSVLNIFAKEDTAAQCYATVNDRDVVFIMKAAPSSRRKGGFSRIVNAVYSMPVLPAEEIAEYRGLNEVYAEELPLTLNELRSRKLCSLDERDVESILISSANSHYPLRLQLVPGIKESNVQDAWTVEAQGLPIAEAETEIVRNFVRAFRNIPVEEIVEDLPPATNRESRADRTVTMRKYGLTTPDYRIFMKPRTCGYRTYLFGIDLPLVKDRELKIFAVSLKENPETGEIERYAMEDNGNSIFRISHKLTRHFALQQNAWKSRNLLSFHISELKRFTLGFMQAPLVLEYESIAESWSGTLGGVDVTANINPHRALNCVDRLRKIKVKEWLDSHDADALEKLETPVFSIKVELEIVDHSDADAIVGDAVEFGHDRLDESGDYRNEGAAAALEDDNELGDLFRNQAFDVKPTKDITYTIEIAPVNNYEDKPLFYGRIKESGQIFLMKFEDAQSIGSSPLEDNIRVLNEQ